MLSLRWFCLGLLFVSPAFPAETEKLHIVELSGDPAAAGMAQVRGAERVRVGARLRDQVRLRQQASLARLAIRGMVVATTETIANAAIVRMSPAEASRLAALPDVVRVEASQSAHLHVDRAADVQGVRPAWELAGGVAKAGAGVKVGIIDTGIDSTHPAFQDAGLTAPEGYPRSDTEEGLASTNAKVIVYRNYEKLLTAKATPTYLDEIGHGTNVASIAAASRHEVGQSVFAGMAPKAWIGAYKVFSTAYSGTETAVYLKALDDAVSDGMDVINLSIGMNNWDNELGVISDAEKRAGELGVQVIYSAGNDGPKRGTVANRPDGITTLVGAASNSRFWGGRLRLADDTVYAAIPVEPPKMPKDPVTAELKFVGDVDSSGLACDPLPANSFTGKIGVAWRGDKPGRCGITTKQANLKEAGAVGLVVMADDWEPEPRGMSAGEVPGLRIGNADGHAILDRLGAGERLQATMEFAWETQETPVRMASLSSRGPGNGFLIKPDLVGVGEYVWIAVTGGKYASGDGTSYSAPMVAGAMAVLKAARPGLTFPQYRSLIVNTAKPMNAPVMEAGAGLLDLEAAMRGTVTVDPVSVSFGVQDGSFSLEREITITNLGEAGTFSLTVEPMGDGPAPSVDAAQIALDAKGQQTVRLRLEAQPVAVGEYQGFIVIQGAAPGARARIAYWFAVPVGRTEAIATGMSKLSGTTGTVIDYSLWFRITDRFGIPTRRTIRWNRTSGDTVGLGLSGMGPANRGMWLFSARLGPRPGRSIFRFTSDDAQEDIWYTAKGDALEQFLVPSTYEYYFGDVPVGQAKETSVRLFSLGSGAVRVRGFTPPAPSFTVRSPALPFDIAAGGTADITIRYAPTTTTVHYGWFQILNNDAQMSDLGIWVVGRGVPAPDSPVPVLTSIAPDNARVGAAGLTLTVEGSSFVNGSAVEWNGNARPTTFVSTAKLTAAIPAADLAQAGSARVTVFNPAPGGGRSAALTFRIEAAAITPLTQTWPAVLLHEISAGGCPELTVYVNAFDRDGKVVDRVVPGNFTCKEDAQPVRCEVMTAADANKPLSVVLVLGSNQMGNAFDAVKSGANSFLELLTPQDRVAVIHLETEARAVQTFTADKRQAAAMIDALRVVGDGNALYDALLQAAVILPYETGRRHAIVLVTGAGNLSGTARSAQTVLDRLRTAGLPVFAVPMPGFSRTEEAGALLQRLSVETQGLWLGSDEEVGARLRRAGQVLATQFAATYVSGKTDGRTHDLEIEVKSAVVSATGVRTFTACRQ